MSQKPAIRVLIADDHPMFRYGLRTALESHSEILLVGEASSGEQAVAMTIELEPEVVMMDLTMPGLNGIEATRQILASRPDCRIIVLSMFDDSASVLAAIRAGASGYLVKGADRDQVLRAIMATAAGGAIFSNEAAAHLSRQISIPSHNTPVIPGLTNREHDILALMAEGYTNTAISEQLGLSNKSVRNYVSSVLSKLGEVDRAKAIERARAAGLARGR